MMYYQILWHSDLMECTALGKTYYQFEFNSDRKVLKMKLNLDMDLVKKFFIFAALFGMLYGVMTADEAVAGGRTTNNTGY